LFIAAEIVRRRRRPERANRVYPIHAKQKNAKAMKSMIWKSRMSRYRGRPQSRF
jgi:hypothetical protein